ncbi:hypothetical protein [Curtobacterium sp. 20TX0008]|uniref:hypothetical protein n=1 Tax=Curtobacterium sp. 20TX0008 TaxID=3022018 RepID=UPI00232C8FFA|nr:hypothetical protein [Curtobacterium sp. 20TX0008]MDB6425872.1 hypothetical protein [Curtobacterium sp. 20TX0008]
MSDDGRPGDDEKPRPAQRAQWLFGRPTVGWSIAGSAVGVIWALVALLNHHGLLGVIAALYLAVSLARLIYALRIRHRRSRD